MINAILNATTEALEIIAFIPHDQQVCVRTKSIREIRGWPPVASLPHAPAHIIGVMNLPRTPVPIVDFAARQGIAPTNTSERGAIVVTNMQEQVIGMMVDAVSGVLRIYDSERQPISINAGIVTAGHAEEWSLAMR